MRARSYFMSNKSTQNMEDYNNYNHDHYGETAGMCGVGFMLKSYLNNRIIKEFNGI